MDILAKLRPLIRLHGFGIPCHMHHQQSAVIRGEKLILGRLRDSCFMLMKSPPRGVDVAGCG